MRAEISKEAMRLDGKVYGGSFLKEAIITVAFERGATGVKAGSDDDG